MVGGTKSLIVVFAMPAGSGFASRAFRQLRMGRGATRNRAGHARSTRSGTLPLSPHSVVCNHAAGFASSPAHMSADLDAFKWTLDETEMRALTELSTSPDDPVSTMCKL